MNSNTNMGSNEHQNNSTNDQLSQDQNSNFTSASQDNYSIDSLEQASNSTNQDNFNADNVDTNLHDSPNRKENRNHIYYPSINKSDYPKEDPNNPLNNEIIKNFKVLNNFYLNLNNYLEDTVDNGFLTFKRGFITSPTSYSPYSKKRMHIPYQSSANDSRIKSPSKSADNYQTLSKTQYNIHKLDEMKHIFLTHFYKTIPETFNEQYFINQMTCYMKKQNNSLSYLQGFTFTDINGHYFPIVFTERPVNGPLTSFFSTVKKIQSEKVTADRIQICPSRSFNIESLNAVTGEQKFSIIVGIIHGITFIHKNNFVHSNLSPATVYLDEKYQPSICDYIFVPSFDIETLEKKSEHDPFQFKYYSRSENSMQPSIYTAPELVSGERKEIGPAIDIYSLGLIIFFILQEKEAKFSPEGEIIYPEEFPEKWRQIVDDCTKSDPSKRPSAKDILGKLLDRNNMKSFISSLNPESSSSQISEKTNLSLTIMRTNVESGFDVKPKFDIVHRMIPNISDIDDDTRLIISAAEKGDLNSIEKVGDFFYNGQNNFYKDEEWALECYEKACSNGDPKLKLKIAEFYEKGIGTDIDLEKSVIYYTEAIENLKEDDPDRSTIESKINDLNEKMRKIIVKDVTPEKKKLFNSFLKKIKHNSVQNDPNGQVRIIFDDPNDTKKAGLKFDKYKKKLKLDYESFISKEIETKRFDSLKDLPKIDLDDFYPGEGKEFFESLGCGASADIYLVFNKKTNKKYAAKVYKDGITNENINYFKREIIVASKFNHPSILKYIGYSQFSLINKFIGENIKDIKPTILMELIEGGDLRDKIRKDHFQEENWNNTDKLKTIIGIASGLAEMYNKQIIHRDLKPENILLNKDLEPKICDLGCSRQYSEYDHDRRTGGVGTPYYMAPELYSDSFNPDYKCEVDSYSFGIILYQILTSTLENDLYGRKINSYYLSKFKLANYRADIPDDMADIFKDLIYKCWNVVVDERYKPPMIYKILVDAVNDESIVLLNDVDIEEVKSYIKKLNDSSNKVE